MKTQLEAVLYARHSPRPEPKVTDRELTEREKSKKRKADEDREKNSCDKQIEYGREYCARMGYRLDENMIFRDDAMSGASMNKRTGLKYALAACGRGKIFIARDTKRVARDRFDTLVVIRKLLRRGALFETIADGRYDATDVNKVMVFGIKAVVAECERMTISQDTKAKMQRHQANGRRMSKIAPFGFAVDPEDDTHLLPYDEEQPTVERIKELHGQGVGYRGIGRQLEAEGLLCRGRSWQHNTIKRIIDRSNRLRNS